MSSDATTCCLTCVRPHRIACTLVAHGSVSWRCPAPNHFCVACAVWGARLSAAVVADIGGEGRVDHCRKWQSQIALGTRGRRDTELSMSLSYPSRGKGHVAQSPQHERGPHCEDTAHRTLPALDTRIRRQKCSYPPSNLSEHLFCQKLAEQGLTYNRHQHAAIPLLLPDRRVRPTCPCKAVSKKWHTHAPLLCSCSSVHCADHKTSRPPCWPHNALQRKVQLLLCLHAHAKFNPSSRQQIHVEVPSLPFVNPLV
mmetsp:Transcript_96861/g.156258  ORF Transcript_96861/g.156258 Transcript_96861/m.156258 type:complete len:254 (-) Transcript_96861:256-1017(-)